MRALICWNFNYTDPDLMLPGMSGKTLSTRFCAMHKVMQTQQGFINLKLKYAAKKEINHTESKT